MKDTVYCDDPVVTGVEILSVLPCNSSVAPNSLIAIFWLVSPLVNIALNWKALPVINTLLNYL